MSQVRASGVALVGLRRSAGVRRATKADDAWADGAAIGQGRLVLVVSLLLLWQLVAWVVPARNRFLFPSPLLTVQALWASLPELGKGTLSSFIILIPGYAAAVVAGVVLGHSGGTTRWLERFDGAVHARGGPGPPTVYVPYAIALLPGFRSAAIAVVFIGAFWPSLSTQRPGPRRCRSGCATMRACWDWARPSICAGWCFHRR